MTDTEECKLQPPLAARDAVTRAGLLPAFSIADRQLRADSTAEHGLIERFRCKTNAGNCRSEAAGQVEVAPDGWRFCSRLQQQKHLTAVQLSGQHNVCARYKANHG